MAFAVKTLSDLKQSLADRHDAGTLPTDSTILSYWTRLLNRAKDYCSDRLKLTKKTSLTTSSGVIVFPDDYILCNAVVDSDNLYWRLISKEDSVGASGNVYWVTGDQDNRFSLNIPDSANKTFTVYYTFRPADMSVDADECVIPDIEAVVARAYAMLRLAEFDPAEDADKAFGECERRLDEIIYQRNLNDGGNTLLSSESRNSGNTKWPVV